MTTRLKVSINCDDCGAERLITRACLNLVKRCKPCQKIFNRDKARNRYRAIKGIPLDNPIVNIIEKKKKEPKPVLVQIAPMAKSTPIKVKSAELAVPTKEQQKRQLALAKLLGVSASDNDNIEDDW